MIKLVKKQAKPGRATNSLPGFLRYTDKRT